MTGKSDNTTTPLTSTSSDGLDLIWGCAGIAVALGRTPRATFHLLESGEIPVAKKVGGRWVVSRKSLKQHFGGGEVAA